MNRCPIQGCDREVEVVGTFEGVTTFTCPKHGKELIVTLAGLSKEVRERLHPPTAPSLKAKYTGLASHAELQEYIRRGSRGQEMLYAALKRIAKTFAAQFRDNHMCAYHGNLYKAELYKVWKRWFAGHYYEPYISMNLVGKAFKELGLKDDPNSKYFYKVKLC